MGHELVPAMTSVFRRKGRAGFTVKYIDPETKRYRYRSFRRREDADMLAQIVRQAPITQDRRLLLLGEAQRFAMLTPEKTASFDMPGLLVIALRQPLVYAWLRDGRTLYVGRGLRGMVRPLNPSHHRLDVIRPADTLRVWPAANEIEAALLEERLIGELRPELNGPGFPPRRKKAEPAALAEAGQQSL